MAILSAAAGRWDQGEGRKAERFTQPAYIAPPERRQQLAMVKRRATGEEGLQPERPQGVRRRLPLTWGALVVVVAVLAMAPVGRSWAGGSHQPTASSNAVAPGAAEEAFAPSSSQQVQLGEHLRRLGYLFYGAWWCPACRQQKSLFGQQAAQSLPYVECEKSEAGRQRCNEAAIRAYPTWVRGSERRVGVLSLQELQSWSGFRPGATAAAASGP